MPYPRLESCVGKVVLCKVCSVAYLYLRSVSTRMDNQKSFWSKKQFGTPTHSWRRLFPEQFALRKNSHKGLLSRIPSTGFSPSGFSSREVEKNAEAMKAPLFLPHQGTASAGWIHTHGGHMESPYITTGNPMTLKCVSGKCCHSYFHHDDTWGGVLGGLPRRRGDLGQPLVCLMRRERRTCSCSFVTLLQLPGEMKGKQL